jgi:hypothetical protein
MEPWGYISTHIVAAPKNRIGRTVTVLEYRHTFFSNRTILSYCEFTFHQTHCHIHLASNNVPAIGDDGKACEADIVSTGEVRVKWIREMTCLYTEC